MSNRHYKSLAALVCAAIAATAVTACGGTSSPRAGGTSGSTASTTPPSSPSPSPTDTASSFPRYVAASVATGDAPSEAHAGFGSVWIVTHRGGDVERIDPATNKVTKKIPSPGSELISIAVGAQHVWYLDGANQQVEGIDPRSNTITVKTPVGTDGGGVTATASGVWFAGPNGKVFGIDPANGRVLKARRLAADGSFLTPFAIGGKLWVADSDHSMLYSLDPSSLAVHSKQHLEGQLGAFGYGFGSLWVGATDGALYQLNADTGAQLRKIALHGVDHIAFGPKLVWVRETDVQMVGIDPHTGKVVREYQNLPSSEVPGGGIDWVNGSLWVVNWSDNDVWRIPEAS